MNAAAFRCRVTLHACMTLAVLVSACGCGLKGQLYMPDEKPDMVEVRTPAIPGIPGTSKKERENRGSSSKQSGGTTAAPQSTPEK